QDQQWAEDPKNHVRAEPEGHAADRPQRLEAFAQRIDEQQKQRTGAGNPEPISDTIFRGDVLLGAVHPADRDRGDDDDAAHHRPDEREPSSTIKGEPGLGPGAGAPRPTISGVALTDNRSWSRRKNINRQLRTRQFRHRPLRRTPLLLPSLTRASLAP